MARRNTRARRRQVENYAHEDKERVNNPPVGLVTPDTDPDTGTQTYEHDPHIDPYLSWAGKAEHTSFEVPTVSLHVHERIDSRTIIEAARKRDDAEPQMSLFQAPEENPPLRDAIEFYKHRHNWSNRLIAGDSLLVMNSLLEKEGLGGQVQMVFIDPPYGIRYGSNFQPFVNKRDVKDNKDEDLTQEPETIRAFRDTWELGIHSYLTYLQNRLALTRELLTDSGSCFVQIGDENVHIVRCLLDEVFGVDNFISLITFTTSVPLGSTYVPGITNYLLWYGKNKKFTKFRRIYLDKTTGGGTAYSSVELPDHTRRSMTAQERANPSLLPDGTRYFFNLSLLSAGTTPSCVYDFEYDSRVFSPGGGRSWKTTKDGMNRLVSADRIFVAGNTIRYVLYADDYPVSELTNNWVDTSGASDKVYVVQTMSKVIQRCILMTTDPGDLVFDPTCGSGTTAYVAEQWGRRWITCDTSRVATTLAKQRLMTANFDYYELARQDEGVGSGFNYKTVPHVTLGSIANNPDIREEMSREEIDNAIARHAPQETLYDQPTRDTKKARVTGPFTVEAVPAPAVKPIDDIEDAPLPEADGAIARTGETLREADWRDELSRTGIRGKAGQRISFVRLEPLSGARWLHAEGETRPDDSAAPERVAVSFGPEHAPMEQRQVELAIEEARTLVPKPRIIVFAAFQFDPEASKDIDETNWPGVTLLKAQMNADLLTEDLKRKRASNESFWLIGQPDVEIERIQSGEDEGKFRVMVQGFDYYNTRSGDVESGGQDKIAMWMLDPDYDGRSLFPRQVFFPMAGAREGWAKLARNLRAEIDEDLIEAYRGIISLPFAPGEHGRAAVKIVDDRGIESLKILELK